MRRNSAATRTSLPAEPLDQGSGVGVEEAHGSDPPPWPPPGACAGRRGGVSHCAESMSSGRRWSVEQAA